MCTEFYSFIVSFLSPLIEKQKNKIEMLKMDCDKFMKKVDLPICFD